MKRVLIAAIGLFLALGLWLAFAEPKIVQRTTVSSAAGEPSGTQPAAANRPAQPDESSISKPAASTPISATPRLALSTGSPSSNAPRPTVELPPAVPGKPTPPASLSGFWSWPEDQVERIVTGMQSQPDWPADQRQFLRAALREPSLSPVARNNIAAGLMRQEPPIPDLHRDFLAMQMRADEDLVWRDYCLQFLAQCTERVEGAERDAIVAALVAAIDSEVGSLPGTAVLHLARLSETGLVTLGETYDRLVTRLATNTSQNEANRSTALVVLGQRGYSPALEEARKMLSSDELIGIKRAAIGVVSLLGSRDDLALLKNLRTHADPSVALVATHASKAMNDRLGTTPEQ